MQKMRFKAKTIPTIAVWPRTAEYAKLLRHPSGVGFRGPDQSMPWPHDSFTMRLIRDGEILTQPPPKSETSTDLPENPA